LPTRIAGIFCFGNVCGIQAKDRERDNVFRYDVGEGWICPDG
jgi:hypothetical protein